MIKNQTIKERLLLFINAKEIRKSHFEKACGLSNGYINSIINTISVEKLEDILKAYPEINRVWLLTGEGEMINNGDKSVTGDNNNNISHVIQSNVLYRYNAKLENKNRNLHIRDCDLLITYFQLNC